MAGFLERLFSLEGRVAIVTGASSGIGRRMAGALSRAGAAVVLVARRREQLADAVEDIVVAGGKAHALAADLMHLERLDAVQADASRPFGTPDILVNAAGLNPRLPPDALSPETWNATVTLNLTVPFFLARAVVPGMIAKGQGNIINIASLQSWRAFPNGMPYGASKGGITQLTRAMAEAWSRHGIVANAIAPGFFPTELTAPVFANPDVAGHHARMTAIGRNGELADLDGATIFFASGASRYITGQVLPVDGGYTAK